MKNDDKNNSPNKIIKRKKLNNPTEKERDMKKNLIQKNAKSIC